jgi:hypothetical protein
MRRALLTAALALAALPSTASAAPFAELPFRPVTSSAVCLAPTGAPGGLVRWTPKGAELLEATAAGLVPRAEFALGSLETCPAAAEDPSGAGVIAGATRRGVKVAVRDPGGGWGAPVTFASKLASGVSVALSARGDAVVVWREFEADFEHSRLLVVRRTAGGAFGPPQRLAREGLRTAEAQVALEPDGTALLVLTDDRAARLVSAAPGAPFGAPRRLVASNFFGDEPVLAVAPNGRALLVVPTDEGTALFDRDPGGEFVRRPTLRGGDGDLAVALLDDGTALLAWQSDGQISLLRRDGTGPFGAPIRLDPEPPPPPSLGTSFGLYGSEGPPIEPPRTRIALGGERSGDERSARGSGRALVVWPGRDAGLWAATVTAAGQAELIDVGGRLRPATGMTPLLLADGTRVIAWTDQNELLSVPPYAGRLHLAVEGAAEAPAPAAPELTVGVPRDRSLRPAQPLVLPVRCSAACDIRATIAGQHFPTTASLTRAGTAVLRFNHDANGVVPKRGPLKVQLRWSAPGARTASSRTVSLRLRRLPAPPLPRLLDVRARRAANGVVDVRWRTDGPALDAYFVVAGTRTRGLESDREPKVGTAAGGARRRSFHVRLKDAASVRYVHVIVAQPYGGGGDRRVRVRVQ